MRSARLPVNLIGSPINYANHLIDSPITSQSTGRSLSGLFAPVLSSIRESLRGRCLGILFLAALRPIPHAVHSLVPPPPTPAPAEVEQGDRQAKGPAERERELLVRVLDVRSLTWSVLTPAGDAPPARAGHSVRLCHRVCCPRLLWYLE